MGMAILVPLLDLESDFSLIFGGVLLQLVAFSILLRFLRQQMPQKAPAARFRPSLEYPPSAERAHRPAV